ncbi:hypothetical protein [Streptomyces jumonjinensis]|uniref:hypothetical protein n=1 Tax=Streptomyces jumonjinensis TaxID=1945 RepID=UPI00379E8951
MNSTIQHAIAELKRIPGVAHAEQWEDTPTIYVVVECAYEKWDETHERLNCDLRRTTTRGRANDGRVLIASHGKWRGLHLAVRGVVSGHPHGKDTNR